MEHVPTEIWDEIFRYCVWTDFDFDEQEVGRKNSRFKLDKVCSVLQSSFPRNDIGGLRSKKWKTLRAPFVLTHVCQSWRSIVLATPYLWSFIRCRIPARVEQIPVWLGRSKGYPLYIKLSVIRGDIGGHLDGFKPVQPTNFMHDPSLNALLWHCKRWVEADLNLWSGHGQLENVLRRINGAAPMLRRLHTRSSILYGQNLSSDYQLSANNLPSLTDLTWASDELQDILSFPRYPNLTRFSGAFYTVQSLVSVFFIIFESMPELTVLELGIQKSFESLPETNLPHIVHECLTSLKLEWFGKHNEYIGSRCYVNVFLEHVDFPSLTSFALFCGGGTGQSAALSGFLSRHPKLEALTFSFPDCDVRLVRCAEDHASSSELLSTINLPYASSVEEITLPPGGNWVITKDQHWI
ncbi:hypothetical protein VKT23_017040 [Stygiomarasmius scandens]|uniref:F-box domain-containing protein n=1 Tax=Marasmiellus scandens TaxID=2682957 RepID=A0ABR1IXE1_9AGAR